MLLAPLAVARALLSFTCLLLAWGVIRLALVGEHPTRPLPKWKEAVSRSIVKAIGRCILFIIAGGRISVKVRCFRQTSAASSAGPAMRRLTPWLR